MCPKITYGRDVWRRDSGRSVTAAGCALQLKTFETEVYGVLEKQRNTYLPERLVDEAFAGPVVRKCTSGKREPVYVAVDPPSHQRSNFGVMALIYGSSGGTQPFVPVSLQRNADAWAQSIFSWAAQKYRPSGARSYRSRPPSESALVLSRGLATAPNICWPAGLCAGSGNTRGCSRGSWFRSSSATTTRFWPMPF